MIDSNVLAQLGSGMIKSVEIFFLTLLFSLPLGMLVALGRMSRFKILSGIIKVYIAIMRGTPLMLQLIVVYFAPYYVFGLNISSGFRFTAVIIAFSINYAEYFAEIFRAGIQRTRCLVHDNNCRILGENARDFDTLSLPSGEIPSSL